MGKSHTINKSQINAANQVLERLRRALAPEFIGLISTDGHPITVISSDRTADADSLASLAASSFAATKQLAQVMDDPDFTLMFHEGSHLNIHISQITDDALLVICFHKATQLGKVRLIARRSLEMLAAALKPLPRDSGAPDGYAVDYLTEAGKAIDELFDAEEEENGTH